MARTGDPKKSAVRFIVLLGTVSLFADITYEGARSINGPYLGLLGASAVVVGAVAGAGEFIGHALRLVSGLLSDRTRRYWVLLITGYTVNLLAVPALALAGRWEMAAGLMILERVGKAIRAPARDVLLSGAARRIGTGWGFGLHEALDQIGALTGPLVLAAVLGYGGGYRMCYAVLLVPAFMALSVLTAAKLSYGQPGNGFETVSQKTSARNLPRAFWLYLAASGLMAAGFADFPLIAFHLGKAGIVKEATVPLFTHWRWAWTHWPRLPSGVFLTGTGFHRLSPLRLCRRQPLRFCFSAPAEQSFWVLCFGEAGSERRKR